MAILSWGLLGVVGVLCLAAVPALFRAEAERRRTRDRGVPATGTVVEAGVDDETAYVTLEYEYGGVRYAGREYWMSGPVGRRVPVLVDPADPTRTVPVDAAARWFIAPALLACGLAAVACSAAAIHQQCSRPGHAAPAGPPAEIRTWQYVGDDGKMSIHFTPPTDAQQEATRQHRASRSRPTPREGEPGFVGPPRPPAPAR